MAEAATACAIRLWAVAGLLASCGSCTGLCCSCCSILSGYRPGGGGIALPAFAPLLWDLLPPRLPRVGWPRPRPLLLRPPCCCSMLCMRADQRWCSAKFSCLPACKDAQNAMHITLQLP